jgi:hypothetical protein
MNKFLAGIFVFSILFSTGCMTAGQCVNSDKSRAKDRFCNSEMDNTATALTGQPQGKRGVCPVCGRQFGKDVKYCPYDGAVINTAAK